MVKGLTNSNLGRQNMLNNQYVLKEIKWGI